MMRSEENARTALDDGKVDTAIKMMKSTDALCSRVVAPPTVHGIALRVLADAYMEKAAGRTESGTVEASESGEDAAKDNGKEEAEEESDYVDCAKRTLKKALDICKVHDGKAGMPRFMVQDLAGRMGDLYAAQGEIFRQEGNYKEALRSLRLGIGKFEVLGANEFVGATYNRVAYCYMEKEQWKEALEELQNAERIVNGVEAESAILSTTFAYRGECLKRLDKIQLARAAFESALKFGMASGNEGVVREAEEFLAQTQQHSTVDDSAFL